MAPWCCPACRRPLLLAADGRSWSCAAAHVYDVARQGYVNLLRTGRRRAGGDSAEMVAARRAFLSTDAYAPISDAVNAAAGQALHPVVVDVGCGEGYYTRRLAASLAGTDGVVCGVDVAKPAVAAAAAAHRSGSYAVASAFDLPIPASSCGLALSVFGPVAPAELARVVVPGGSVVAVHPGPRHLWSLRQMVYEAAAPHEVKDPLRAAGQCFEPTAVTTVTYLLTVSGGEQSSALLTMTPYRWHAPRDIFDRLAGGLVTEVDVVVSTYRRR